jgi:hypothetical protein
MCKVLVELAEVCSAGLLLGGQQEGSSCCWSGRGLSKLPVEKQRCGEADILLGLRSRVGRA